MDNNHVAGTAARHPLSGPSRRVHFTLTDPGSPSFYLEDHLSFLNLSATSTPHPTRRPVRHGYCC